MAALIIFPGASGNHHGGCCSCDMCNAHDAALDAANHHQRHQQYHEQRNTCTRWDERRNCGKVGQLQQGIQWDFKSLLVITTDLAQSTIQGFSNPLCALRDLNVGTNISMPTGDVILATGNLLGSNAAATRSSPPGV